MTCLPNDSDDTQKASKVKRSITELNILYAHAIIRESSSESNSKQMYPTTTPYPFTINIQSSNEQLTVTQTEKELQVEISGTRNEAKHTLLWSDGKNFNCSSSFNNTFKLTKFTPQTTYTFCLINREEPNDIRIIPTHCRSVETQPLYKNRPWLLNYMKWPIIGTVIGATIIIGLVGAGIMFLFARERPKILKSKKIITVKAKYLAMPFKIHKKQPDIPQRKSIHKYRIEPSETSFTIENGFINILGDTDKNMFHPRSSVSSIVSIASTPSYISVIGSDVNIVEEKKMNNENYTTLSSRPEISVSIPTESYM